MRNLKIITIIFLAGAAVCLSAILYLALSQGYRLGNRFGMNGDSNVQNPGNYSLALEKELDAESVRSLKIDYGRAYNDVYFYATDGDAILIREYMNFTPRESQISAVELNGQELSIRGTQRRSGFFSSFSVTFQHAYTEVYMPAGLADGLEELYVKTVSGDIFSDVSFYAQKGFYASSTSGDILFPEIKAGQIQIASTSGNIRLTDAAAESIHLSTVSGDISVEQAEGDTAVSATSGNVTLGHMDGDIRISTISGDMSVGEAKGSMTFSSTSGIQRLQNGTGSFEADTTSGDILVERLDGNFNIQTTSGDFALSEGSGCGGVETISGEVRIFLRELNGDLDVSTTSGNVNFRLPGTGSWILNFDSASGECSTFFDDQLQFNKRGNHAEGQYGDGGKIIEVSTTSGDLKITEY